MRLTTEQLLAIAPRVLPFEACKCGCAQVRINPELVRGSNGPVVEVHCTGCARFNTFAAAELGLVSAVAERGAMN